MKPLSVEKLPLLTPTPGPSPPEAPLAPLAPAGLDIASLERFISARHVLKVVLYAAGQRLLGLAHEQAVDASAVGVGVAHPAAAPYLLDEVSFALAKLNVVFLFNHVRIEFLRGFL